MLGYGPHWGMTSHAPMMVYGPKWGMMSGLGGATFGGPFAMITWPLLIVAAAAGVVWFVRSTASPIGSQTQTGHRSSGLNVLEERYARGEIDRDEYLQKKKDIG